MPWYAQRADLPDTHKTHADPASEMERALVRLGYVEVPPLGAEVELPAEVPVLTEDELLAARALGLPVDDPDAPASPAWVRSQLAAVNPRDLLATPAPSGARPRREKS